ncbi:hypothetical protein IEQ34_015528 [Dendrobium chrysotoxum]|uniref:Uncharacterized protein n=1 Tax=Dendrobium chrysotoxum TaxID=161865 RepID=A0AAV7GHD7_DENCH|nr:hypothetical protein IEQ34_015528 [Dendrobium chrysotoxum]
MIVMMVYVDLRKKHCRAGEHNIEDSRIISEFFNMMETLVEVAQHRNHGYSGSYAQLTEGVASSPSRRFNGFDCWTFQSGHDSFPTFPSYHRSYAHASASKSSVFRSEPPKLSRRRSLIAIIPKKSPKISTFCEELSCSELWAGPTYSISPPPSSLPIPKFSLPQKHSISLDLPISRSKSAPASPIGDSRLSSPDFFSTASATDNLRRILNLDLIN